MFLALQACEEELLCMLVCAARGRVWEGRYRDGKMEQRIRVFFFFFFLNKVTQACGCSLYTTLVSASENHCRQPKEHILFCIQYSMRNHYIMMDQNISVYCLTEEVMLAEESKNSGRSPLDGK